MYEQIDNGSNLEIVEILKKQPQQRTQSDIKRLMTSTEQIPFFQKYIEQGNENVIKKCCKHMKYQEMKSGEIVFEIDSIGTQFYLILSGKVGVYIKSPQNLTTIKQPQQTILTQKEQKLDESPSFNDMNKKIEPEPKRKITLTNISQPLRRPTKILPRQSIFQSLDLNYYYSAKKNRQLYEILIKNKKDNGQIKQQYEEGIPQFNQRLSKITKAKEQEENQEKSIRRGTILENKEDKLDIFNSANKFNMICVKTIDQGNAFGELALLNNKPRLATIICLENCQFAILDKQDFTKILKQIEENLLEQEISFLADLHIFQGWNKNLLKQLYLNSQRINYNRGQIIFKEGDQCDNVYIVSKGEFIGSKKLVLNFERESILDREYPDNISLNEQSKTQNCQKLSEQIQIQVQSLFKDGFNSDLLKFQNNLQQKMSVLTPYEMFGEEDVLQKQNRSYSVKCSSLNGQLIVIKTRNFNMRILQDDYTRQYLYDRLSKKESAFEERAEKILSQYKQYKNYLISFKNQPIDNCLESIKKSAETSHYNTQQYSNSPKKLQNGDNTTTSLNGYEEYNIASEKLPQANSNNDILMLRNAINYDLKYHRKSLQRGILGVQEKEMKEQSIRKNQKEVNLEMQHYAQQFNQYHPDKFINMNNQEEKNNQIQYNSQSDLKKEDQNASLQLKRSNSVTNLKNETRDRLLDSYRQQIYIQSSIHFKIKCHLAQKPKSDRSQTNYLKILREKNQNQNLNPNPNTKITIQKRERALSANNLATTKEENNPIKQAKFLNRVSNKSHKTENSPEKQNIYPNPINSTEDKKIMNINDYLQITNFTKQIDQNQESIYKEQNEQKQEQKQLTNLECKQQILKNSNIIKIVQTKDCNDKIKFYFSKPSTVQKQKSMQQIKQQCYQTNYFSQNYKQIQITNSNKRSSSYSQVLETSKKNVALSTNPNSTNQSPKRNSDDRISLKQKINNQRTKIDNSNFHSCSNSEKVNSQENNSSKKREEIAQKKYGEYVNEFNNQNLFEQLKKSKWKYEKYDIIGNQKIINEPYSLLKNNPSNHIQTKNNNSNSSQQQLLETFLISKLTFKL